ncbi:MAG: undecaprenyl/decaprenyl-phosphate alpha-N-acetylglucosaminyl 1-phosphate transferase [Acidobacteria bacterium]|nr:undecaprenyl/decaprenyl-phosphate alpha-N-acetylglucosaminyl 1-phosphate transferase [Acidobacteriota bacterium]
MRTYLGLLLVSALFTLLITPAMTALGHRLRAYGPVQTGRERPAIPRMGGLAILLAMLAAWSVLLLIPNDVRSRFQADWPVLVAVLLPAMLVTLVGGFDDLKGATAWQKLMVEVMAAGIVWCEGFRITTLPILGYEIHSPALSFLLTALWIVAVTNSFNLIDGLDGLAAGIAFFVTLSVFIVSLLQENHFVCIIAITLAGALLGFLKYNFAPAKIFLGDAGSLFLGFLLASLAIYTSQKSSTLLAIIVPFIAFGLPLLDTSLTVARRFLSRRSIFIPDRDHIHHRMLQRTLTIKGAVLSLYALAALFSLGSLLIISSTGNLVALVAVLAGVLAWFFSNQLQYEELSELNKYVTCAMHSQRRILANQILIRKASKQLDEGLVLEESWQILIQTLQALDFDSGACDLSGWRTGSAPVLRPWCRELNENNCWRISIPLYAAEKALGEIRLGRRLKNDHLFFQFSSLLDMLIPAFQKQLQRRYEDQPVSFEYEYGLTKEPALRANLLAMRKNV